MLYRITSGFDGFRKFLNGCIVEWKKPKILWILYELIHTERPGFKNSTILSIVEIKVSKFELFSLVSFIQLTVHFTLKFLLIQLKLFLNVNLSIEIHFYIIQSI